MTDYQPHNILVTGGAGFIGSCFVELLLNERPEAKVINLDLLTYAGNPDNLLAIANNPRHLFVRGDILDTKLVAGLLEEHAVDSIVHFAAESHVDRSIENATPFVRTNVEGTLSLVQAAKASPHTKRYLQVGTDEVYGALPLEGNERFREDTPLAPCSPYSASKAGADLLVSAYCHTFDFPAIITRCSNNYGPRQFPEKLIPLMIHNAMNDKPLPVYGDGLYVRDWIHVSDHCRGVLAALTRGRLGEVYNLGGNCELPNIKVVKTILELLNKPKSLIQYVTDRLGHDRRYAIDPTKSSRDLKWDPLHNFTDGLRETIEWYQTNTQWLEGIASGAYQADLDT